MKEKKAPDLYYRCPNPKCGYVVKIPRKVIDENPEAISEIENNLDCPECGQKGFKKLSDEETREYLIKKKRAEEKKVRDEASKLRAQKVGVAKDVVKYIETERKKLFEDLKEKLLSGQITPKRFIALFYSISCDIMVSRKKEYLPDWASERKIILAMGQDIIDLYGIQEEQEEIIAEYDVNADKIYEVYHEKYIEGDELAYNEYIGESRLNDYMRKIEERNKKRVERASEKQSDKVQAKLEMDFKKSLNDGIKKIN